MTKRTRRRPQRPESRTRDGDVAPETALLLREPLPEGPVWVFEPPDEAAMEAIRAAARGNVRASTCDVRRLGYAGAVDPSAGAAHADAAVALIYLPKGKARQRMALDLAADALGPDGEVRVAGGKRVGIKSARRLVGERFTGALSVDAGKHAQVVIATEKRGREGSPAWPVVRLAVEVPGGPLTCVWYPGVYGEGKLDEGTALLLGALASHRTERVAGARALDVGAGCGLIGAWLSRAGAATVELVDADLLAVASAAATLREMNAKGWRAYASDVYAAAEGRFDLIVSNPPFHQGVGTDYDIAARLISEAPRHLAPGGRLILVANAFLPYRDLLDAAFGGATVTVLAETSRFRVYEAITAR